MKRSPLNAWRSRSFQRVAFVTAVIHIAFFTLVPVTPLYLVNRFNADEGFMAIFAMVELAAGAGAAMLAPHVAKRIGTRAMIAAAMLGTAVAALIIGFAPNLYLTLFAAAFSGGCWTAAAGVGLFSFFMDSTPEGEVGAYSTAYNQVIGLSVFIGPMIGSTLANSGVDLALVIGFGAALRLIAGPMIEHSLVRRHLHRRFVPHAL